MSQEHTSANPRGKRHRRLTDYIFSLLFNIAFLVIVNLLPDWNIWFITDEFPRVLWALNTSLAVSIAGTLILILFHPDFLHYLANAVFTAFGILALAVMISVFPFDFSQRVSDWLNTLVRIGLIVGVVASVIGIVVNVVKALGALLRVRE